MCYEPSVVFKPLKLREIVFFPFIFQQKNKAQKSPSKKCEQKFFSYKTTHNSNSYKQIIRARICP